ncbi:MAG: carbohydrate ABC transporter permease [Ignavibacteriales bacterium]|nr:MAG: carbohydrate ABC transporter permease [Ignavibacteriales bacterium]
MKNSISFSKIAIHGLIILFIIFLLFPLLWVVASSLKSTQEIYSGAPTILPQHISFDHYLSVINGQQIFRSMWNSIVVGVVSTIIVILIAVPSAYAMVRYKSKVNNAILGWILVSQIFPVILVMIPLYVLLRYIGLTDSLTGLTLIYVVWSLPFVLWIMHGYVKSIPIELEEAAVLDGASRSQVIFKVLMPLLLPAIGASALFAFISAWNEFFFALVLMKSPTLATLQVELARYTGMEGQARTGPLAAASVIATIPSILLFIFMRKWLTKGLISGALKG